MITKKILIKKINQEETKKTNTFYDNLKYR